MFSPFYPRAIADLPDFIDRELDKKIGNGKRENLNYILRVLPKVIAEDVEKAKGVPIPEPRKCKDRRYDALIEACTSYYYHTMLWSDSPEWCDRTKLDEIWIPRDIYNNSRKELIERFRFLCPVEFAKKRVLFSDDELILRW